jgi:hypothetical protein
MAFYNMMALDKESERMVLEVMDGNPGACTIVCLILSSPLWHPILQALKTQDIVGSELWRVVHDEYQDNWGQFVQKLLNASNN